MSLSDFFSRIADQKKPHSTAESAAQASASVAAPFYGGGAFLHRFLHEAGLKQKKTLPAAVLSVGNITLGGTGKTPFALWLIDFLRAEGKRPALLTRGYGREDEERLVVVHDGRRLLANTREAGDEPVLLAKALGDVPVLACGDRYRSGRLALRKFEVDTLVLDDGFQHHQLARNGDVVLVDCTRKLSALRLFPRGTLREMPRMLNRAHLIVLTRWAQSANPKAVLREVREIAPSVAVVRSRMAITQGLRVSDREPMKVSELAGKKAILLSAIGNPESFRRSVEGIGVRIAGVKALPDHARISKELLLKCDAVRRRLGADYLIVTEKDAVKLVELGNLPPELIAVRVKVEMLEQRDQDRAEQVLRARLAARAVTGFLR